MNSLDIIKQILDKEMGMPAGRVWAYNANVDLPKDKDLFIVLSYMSRKPYSNNVRYKGDVENLKEVQTMNVCEEIIISLLSQNTQARDRAYEVQMALGSTYSQQVQEQNKMHISRLGDVYDVSFVEATSRLNRFDVRCRVIRSYSKIKDIDYYNQYSVKQYLFDK